MLKPTERPPPSLHPRFAASITPGPPPVTTAKPASAKRCPVSRAAAYVVEPSATRAEPKIETAGRSIRSTAWKPARNSDAISETSLASVSCVRAQEAAVELARSSLTAALTCGTCARRTMPERRATATVPPSRVVAPPRSRPPDVERAAIRGRARAAARAAGAATRSGGTLRRRRGSRSATRLKRLRKKPANASATSSSESIASAAARHAAAPTPPTIGPASDDPRVLPRVEAHVPSARRSAPRNGMKTGELAGRARRRRPRVVAELVDEDQEDEADRERPAPDQRVAATERKIAEELQRRTRRT